MRGSAIGIFDSGVGGLSIWKAIVRKLPNANTIYLADQAHLPYGEKSRAYIRKRAEKITSFLIEKNCKLITVACNSATVAAIGFLRQSFPVPFVGVEPAVKPAAAKSQTGAITVLATPLTAGSSRQRRLIKEHANHVKVQLLALPELVELVESGVVVGQAAFRKLNAALSSKLSKNSDILVLACTHYIFLKAMIRKCLSNEAKVYEPSAAVARRVASLLAAESKKENRKAKHLFFTTADSKHFSQVATRLIGKPVKARRVDL